MARRRPTVRRCRQSSSSPEEHTADAIERMRPAENEMRIEFPVPVLDVDTSDVYQLSLPRIIEFVTRTGSPDV